MLGSLFRKYSRVADRVAICIPVWRAEPFIEQTLRCAQAQTHANLQILISIDRCDDGTVDICRSFARSDPRIKIFAQTERLGWAANCNFLLDNVKSPFFFFYFHDDLILPHYTERLLKALRDSPQAVSCHCDMGHFGASEHISEGRNYMGSAAQRLATFLVAHNRGSPLRSLTRSNLLDDGLRLPTDAVEGFWANEPYLMRLLAAGVAVRVPGVLYKRWDQRKEGLTEGWKKLTHGQVLSGFRANISSALAIIDGLTLTPSERQGLVFCLYVNMMPRVREFELQAGISPLTPAQALHREFAPQSAPARLGDFGQEVEKSALLRESMLLSLDAKPFTTIRAIE
jgi:hypothetical protein